MDLGHTKELDDMFNELDPYLEICDDRVVRPTADAPEGTAEKYQLFLKLLREQEKREIELMFEDE